MALPFDVANFNLANFAEAYSDIFDSDPKDVAIQLKDGNGNITTKTVANRGKFKKQIWDDVGAAIGQMSRTFYVDAENGSDSNDGSSGAPFKTLRAAVDRTPTGGYGKIYFKSGVADNRKAYYLDPINVGTFVQKKIYIHFGEHNDIYFKVHNEDNASTASTAVISLYDTSLFIRLPGTAKIHLVDKPSSMDWNYLGRTMIIRTGGNSSVYFSGYGHNNSDNFSVIAGGTDHTPYFIGACIRDAGGTYLNAGLYSLYVHFNDNTFKGVIYLYHSTSCVLSLYGYSAANPDDDITAADTISGIVRDANGVPRNIIVNSVL